MRILLPLHGFITWNGGVDLMRVIVTSLRAVAEAQGVQLTFAYPMAWPGQSAEAARLRALAEQYTMGGQIVECEDDPRGINLAAVEANANVIFPTMLAIKTNHVRKVGYIYDFQHRELPELFSAEERARRDAEFADIARRSDALYCTSQSVARGMRDFLGFPGEKIVVMPFTPYANADWFATEPALVRARYGIGGNYVMVCNHFWVHKDHRTAILAFAELAADAAHADLQLVLTGDTSDFRDPDHFENMRALIRTLGVESRVLILGLIPKLDQIALLRDARLLVQPTRYEGGPGGGASYEAVGLGLPVLLSDIGVNREVIGEHVGLFRLGAAGDLAARMRQVLSEARPQSEPAALLERSRQSLSRSGQVLIDFLRRL